MITSVFVFRCYMIGLTQMCCTLYCKLTPSKAGFGHFRFLFSVITVDGGCCVFMCCIFCILSHFSLICTPCYFHHSCSCFVTSSCLPVAESSRLNVMNPDFPDLRVKLTLPSGAGPQTLSRGKVNLDAAQTLDVLYFQ